MSRASLTPYLGPAAVLYVLAAVASLPGSFDLSQWLVVAVAVALSATPLLVLRHLDTPGAARVGGLGLATALALATTLQARVGQVVAVEIARISSFALVAHWLVDLALTVPASREEPGRLGRLRRASMLAALVAVAIAVLEALPPLRVGGFTWLLPVRVARVPELAAALGVLVAFWIRSRRAGAGLTPEAIAQNAWTRAGLAPAVLLVVAVGAWLQTSTRSIEGPWLHCASALCAVLMVRSHVLMIDARYRLTVGTTLRRVLVLSLVTFAMAALAIMLAPLVPRAPLDLALWVIGGVLLGTALHVGLSRLLRTLLAPAQGALFDAIELARARLVDVSSLIDVGAAVLLPLRQASFAQDGQALLYALDPALEVGIDAAGVAHASPAPPPQVLMDHLHAFPFEIVVRRRLEDVMVRRPEVRPLVEALERLDALCVVPLRNLGELEGVLVLPRGQRHASLTLEELDALDRFSATLAAYVAVISRETRAAQRMGEVLVAGEQAQREIEGLRRDIEVHQRYARAQAAAPLSNTEAPLIAYSPKMRACVDRLRALAGMDVPVLLRTPPGSVIEPLLRAYHEHAGRADQVLLVVDCGALSRERQRAAIFGDPQRSADDLGALLLAQGGTLVLRDVAALEPDVQAELAEVVRKRRLRVGTDDAIDVPLTLRLIVTARLDLAPLVEAGRFHAGLADLVEPFTLAVPALRERREDMQSLILMSLDRAARIHGHPGLGLEPDALSALMERRYTHDDAELGQLLDAAATRAEGPRITLAELKLPKPSASTTARPSTAPASVSPLSGTLDDVEKRVLLNALEQAQGNKSEAARSLGLKRTTFLDKLRRHGLDESSPARA